MTRGWLTLSNGGIVSHFNTSDSLVLCTANAHIQAAASPLNTGRDTTNLEIRTSNGPITSSVSLAAPGGTFIVVARTSNSGITLNCDDAPTGVRLVSAVCMFNVAASVAMHPVFEGMYEMSTSNADPAGRGRRVVMEQRSGHDRGTVEGRGYWAGSDHGGRSVEGSLTVHTSNARASLDL